jgi:hypothetical protein
MRKLIVAEGESEHSIHHLGVVGNQTYEICELWLEVKAVKTA